MKRYLMLLMPVLLIAGLTACGGSNEEASDPVEKQTETESKPTQEELNGELKSEAVQAEFEELNSDDAEVGKKIFATGEVSVISEDGMFRTFTLTAEESDGFGMYEVVDVLKEAEYEEGDTVTVYGVYDGKSELGMPKINATVIE